MTGINLLPEELHKICRSCLNKNGVTNLLTHEHDGVLLLHIFSMIATVEIQLSEGSPKLLCMVCTNSVLECYKFRKQIEYSENIISELENQVKRLRGTSEEVYVEITSVNEDRSCQRSCVVEAEEVETQTNKVGKHKNLKSILCNFCFLKFDTYDSYRLHRRKEAEQRRKQSHCTVCNKTVVASKLKDHINSHTKECPYECQLCGEKFRYRSSLSRHRFRHRDKKPHECHICGKGFIQAPTLKDHLRTHLGEKSFICYVCGRRFVTKHALGNHINKHKVKNVDDEMDDNNFCQKCNLKFTTKLNFKSHKLTHISKDFLCNICGKIFSQKSLFDSHFKVHSVVKPFKCFHCKKGFSQKNTLRKHVLIHGKKSLFCSVCGMGFYLKSQLNSHMRKHSGEKPFNCSYCTKAFSHNGSLKIHIRTHTGEKPYVCEFCSKGFPDSSGLNKHLKKHKAEKMKIDNVKLT